MLWYFFPSEFPYKTCVRSAVAMSRARGAFGHGVSSSPPEPSRQADYLPVYLYSSPRDCVLAIRKSSISWVLCYQNASSSSIQRGCGAQPRCCDCPCEPGGEGLDAGPSARDPTTYKIFREGRLAGSAAGLGHSQPEAAWFQRRRVQDERVVGYQLEQCGIVQLVSKDPVKFFVDLVR